MGPGTLDSDPHRGEIGGPVSKRISKADAMGEKPVAVLPGQISLDEFLEGLEHTGARPDVDWTALEDYALGTLVKGLLRADAGVMLRSADHGRAVAIGVFVGGRSQWTTCVDQREVLALLDACAERLESVAGTARVGYPTAKARRRS